MSHVDLTKFCNCSEVILTVLQATSRSYEIFATTRPMALRMPAISFNFNFNGNEKFDTRFINLSIELLALVSNQGR